MEKKNKIAQYHLHKAHPEKLQFELYDLNAYRNRSGALAASPHSHSYYQIIWFFEEGGIHTVDFKIFDIKAHTILFIAKDQVHAFDENLEVNGWLIHFNESFFMHSDVDIFLKYNIFNSNQNPCYSIDAATAEIGTSYILLMQEELNKKGYFGYEEVIRFLLKSLLITMERIHQKDAHKTMEMSNAYELQFYKFKELVEEHYGNHCTVSAYAEALNVSSKTLTTITKTIVGKTPAAIISERLILEAQRLLRYTTLQIGEIAFRLGFEDASYFIKFFKRYMNDSPNKFRKV